MEGGISGRRFSYSRSPAVAEPAGGAAGSSSPLLLRRSPEEIRAQPDKLNLDGRGLDVCPTIQGEEQSLRLLSLKNNRIPALGCLGRLSSLVFLDLYGNRLTSLEGLGSAALPSLRVLMVGRNRISSLTGLRAGPPRLDVLDAHGNDLEDLSGLESCGQLRVLNLASNKLRRLGSPISGLSHLTELNLRRNALSEVTDLICLTNLQRLNISGNAFSSPRNIAALSALRLLSELSLDENPLLDRVDPTELQEALPAVSRLSLSRPLSLELPSSDRISGTCEVSSAALDDRAVDANAPPRSESSPPSRSTEESADDGRNGETLTVVASAAVATATELTGILSEAERGLVRFLGLDLSGLHRSCILELSPRIVSVLGNVRKLRLRANDIGSFSELKRVLELFPGVSYLQIEDNGVCQSAMLRSFCSAVLPQLSLLECNDSTGRSGGSSASALCVGGKTRDPEALDEVVKRLT